MFRKADGATACLPRFLRWAVQKGSFLFPTRIMFVRSLSHCDQLQNRKAVGVHNATVTSCKPRRRFSPQTQFAGTSVTDFWSPEP